MSMSTKKPILTDAAVRSSATEFGASVRPHDFDDWLASVRREARLAGVRSTVAAVNEAQQREPIVLQVLASSVRCAR